MRSLRLPLLLLSPLALLASCEKPEVRVYQAPRDVPPPQRTAQKEEPGHEGHGHAPGEHDTAARAAEAPANVPTVARPQLSYQTPAGWVVGPSGQMTAATFNISADQGAANVSVTPLGNLAGRETDLVNMWRQQAGAEPLSKEEAQKALSSIEVAGGTGQVFEVTGARDGKTLRIVTAMLNRPDGTWFFKLSGDDAVVQAQKPTFQSFIKSFRIGEAATAGAPTAPGLTPAAQSASTGAASSQPRSSQTVPTNPPVESPAVQGATPPAMPANPASAAVESASAPAPVVPPTLPLPASPAAAASAPNPSSADTVAPALAPAPTPAVPAPEVKPEPAPAAPPSPAPNAPSVPTPDAAAAPQPAAPASVPAN